MSVIFVQPETGLLWIALAWAEIPRFEISGRKGSDRRWVYTTQEHRIKLSCRDLHAELASGPIEPLTALSKHLESL